MSPTLDSVPGQWTLWLRTHTNPATRSFEARFVAAAPGAKHGEVIITSEGQTFRGRWKEKDRSVDDNVTFEIEDPEGSGKTFDFTGFMVGLAMGGYIKGVLSTPILSPGSWAASKTGDPL